MPVPNTIADLNQAAASNYPLGTDTVGPNLDDYLRAGFAFTRQLFDGTALLLNTVAGTDTITATCPVPFTAYVAGQTFRFVATGANTTNAVTLNVNGLGAKSITKFGTVALNPGDIAAGSVVQVTYDGTQWQIANIAASGSHGHCRLSVLSATQIRLNRFNGSGLIINGTSQQIPAAGVTYTLSGLAASTLYYVYAYMNAGAMTLELSATGHATHTNGVEIKSGDATRTLVGMVYTTGTTQFADSGASRLCANWFNRRLISARANFTSPRSTSSGATVELNAEIRNAFLCWADETTTFSGWGNVTISGAAGTQANTGFGVDSTTANFDGAIQYQRDANSNIGTAALTSHGTLSEGFHFSTIVGSQSATSSTWGTNYILQTVTRA